MRIGADHGDRGTTIPLILGFFLIALMVVAGAVAAGDAFVQQRSLQDVCDGAAAAGAAGAANLDRGTALGGRALQFGDVQRVVDDYLARDPGRDVVHIRASLSADARTLRLTCSETTRIAFGAMFGRGAGLRHLATSAARAPLS